MSSWKTERTEYGAQHTHTRAAQRSAPADDEDPSHELGRPSRQWPECFRRICTSRMKEPIWNIVAANQEINGAFTTMLIRTLYVIF